MVQTRRSDLFTTYPPAGTPAHVQVRRSLAAVVAAACLLLVPGNPAPAAAAGSYYVSTAGSDANPGTASRPWRTLQKAASAAPAGSAILIRAGSYRGMTVTRPYLTFVAYNGEPVTVTDSGRSSTITVSATHHVTIRGFTVTKAPSRYGAGIRVERASDRITIDKMALTSNRSFGVKVDGSTNVTISNSEIAWNETGIEFSRVATGNVVIRNRIHDNNRMITNDATPYNDRGANGIVFYKTTGAVAVRDNRLWGHRAVSHDYGYDGGAFEIYGARDITISGNVMSNNQNILETGTDGSLPCSNIRFVRNVARGGLDGGKPSEGLVLRCMTSSLIANNTFSDLSDFVYYLVGDGAFAGSLSNLRITNNISSQTGAKVYSIDSSVPTSVSINHELVWQPSGSSIAWVSGKGNTGSLATFRTWTGWVSSGIQANPRFADADLHLQSGSPAIDRGALVSGVTEGFLGAGPDLGRYDR